MPTYDPNQDPDLAPVNDPYDPQEDDASAGSAFERAREDARNRHASEEGRRRIIDGHCAEVRESCQLRREHLNLEEKRSRFERDPRFRQRVLRARGDLFSLGLLFAILTVVFVADLLLGTPDLAENLAHLSMSLFEGEGAQQADTDVDEASVATPKWLRLSIGALIALIAVLLTLVVKRASDEGDVQRSLRLVAPGDEANWQRLRRSLWVRRSIKFGYLIVMVGLFSWLHSFSQSRAITMANLATQDNFSLADLGIRVGGTERDADEELESPSGDSKGESAGEGAGIARGLAKGSLAIYVMLFLLHAMLLFCPFPSTTIDLPLARFSPHKAERQANDLRSRESELLLGIVARLQTTEEPLRGTLVNLSEPVASAANELYGDTIIETRTSARNEAAGTAATDERVASINLAEVPTEEDGFQPNDDDDDDIDPTQAIFGRSA